MRVVVEGVSNDKTGYFDYDLTLEEMESVMDANADKLMSQTLMTKSTLYFPNGRVVEYTYDEKEKNVYKRIGKIKKGDETDKTKL